MHLVQREIVNSVLRSFELDLFCTWGIHSVWTRVHSRIEEKIEIHEGITEIGLCSYRSQLEDVGCSLLAALHDSVTSLKKLWRNQNPISIDDNQLGTIWSSDWYCGSAYNAKFVNRKTWQLILSRVLHWEHTKLQRTKNKIVYNYKNGKNAKNKLCLISIPFHHSILGFPDHPHKGNTATRKVCNVWSSTLRLSKTLKEVSLLASAGPRPAWSRRNCTA